MGFYISVGAVFVKSLLRPKAVVKKEKMLWAAPFQVPISVKVAILTRQVITIHPTTIRIDSFGSSTSSYNPFDVEINHSNKPIIVSPAQDPGSEDPDGSRYTDDQRKKAAEKELYGCSGIIEIEL